MTTHQGQAATAAPAWTAVLQRLRSAIPAACPLCETRARGGELCRPCRADIVDDEGGARCRRCGLRRKDFASCPDCAAYEPAFERTIVAVDYAPPADALVLQLKQSLMWGRAAMLGTLLAQAVESDAQGLRPGTVILPVPSSRAALRRRGFNPAAEIARAAGRRLEVAVRSDVLFVREHDAVRQSTLSRAARLGRASDRFGVRAGGLSRTGAQGSRIHVALVDDVMTTGSTLHAAARSLLDAGAASVVALAVARTPQPDG